MKIYEISCDMCGDLIPLVKDDIASEDTKAAVHNHIKNCRHCRECFDREVTEREAGDKKILREIKAIIMLWAVILCASAVLISCGLPASPANTAVMIISLPLISAFGYMLLQKRRIIIPVCVFVSRFAVQAIVRRRDIYPGNFFAVSAGDVLSNTAAAALCFAGIAVYLLIRFSAGKEN